MVVLVRFIILNKIKIWVQRPFKMEISKTKAVITIVLGTHHSKTGNSY